MGDYLSTTIASPQIIAEGGTISGAIDAIFPAAGSYYGIVEEYTGEYVLIPGSRSYMYYDGTKWVNETALYTVVTALVADEEGLGTVEITVPYTNSLLYVKLMSMAGADPAPDSDDVIDYVSFVLQAPGVLPPDSSIDISAMMELMLTFMIVGMMMKMMVNIT